MSSFFLIFSEYGENSMCFLIKIDWKIWNTLILKELKSTFLKQQPMKIIIDLCKQ